MKDLLIGREYRPRTVEDAIKRVLEIPREEALKNHQRKKNERPVFVITYNPALPSVSRILTNHWRVMTKDPYLKKVIPSPPIWLH